MAREILFKAKRIDNGEWVEGALFDGEKYCVIGQTIKFSPDIENECKIVGFMVDRNTICQYTGLTDKNGNKIWENDVVKAESGIAGSPFMFGMIGKVVYEECSFWIEPKDKEDSVLLFDECAEYEVISNIFDEILGGGE